MRVKILWADDEIEILKPHILFLEQKGYEVETVNNGLDAIERCKESQFDIVFLDENMPGISGLDALTHIKEFRPLVPIIMITKNEEEHIMEEAIGGKIADYLIKPVNPNQILLSLKKNLDNTKLIQIQLQEKFQQKYREIYMELNQRLEVEDWIALFKKITHWELEYQEIEHTDLIEMMAMLKREANQLFSKFIEKNYENWLHNSADAPLMLHKIFKDKIAPKLDESMFLIVIDNLRYDQWRVIRPMISKYYRFDEENVIFSILPTATHYARNALFAGLLPSEIAKKYPQYWLNESDEGGKNNYEKELLNENLKRLGKSFKWSYNKVTNIEFGKKLNDNFNELLNNHFNVVVYNFVDMLSHARSEMKVIKELADDEAAYRSLTESWFEHSPLFEIIKKCAKAGKQIILTTDHGTVRVNNAVDIVGPRDTNTNLRYKTGKNLNYNEKDVYRVKNPTDIFLPKESISNEFVFCKNDDFFVYPNNKNSFIQQYNDSFQHGGISLEELLIPYVELTPKS